MNAIGLQLHDERPDKLGTDPMAYYDGLNKWTPPPKSGQSRE